MLNLCFIQLAGCWLLRSRQTDVWVYIRGQRSEVGICWLTIQIVRLASECTDEGMEDGAAALRKILWPNRSGLRQPNTSAIHASVRCSQRTQLQPTAPKPENFRTRFTSLLLASARILSTIHHPGQAHRR